MFRVALLDSQNGLLRDVQVSEGSLSASIVHPREVFRTAILEATAHLILVHNHPLGGPDAVQGGRSSHAAAGGGQPASSVCASTTTSSSAEAAT